MSSVSAALRSARRPALVGVGREGALVGHGGVEVLELGAERAPDQLCQALVRAVNERGVDVLADHAGDVGLRRQLQQLGSVGGLQVVVQMAAPSALA